MRTYARCTAVALVAALVLCVAAASSSALEGIDMDTGGRVVTLTSARLTFTTSGGSVVCPVTLTASLAGTFAKTETNLIGPISSATMPSRSCTGGSATLLTETLPWEVEYYSFAGTLPRITSLSLGIEELSALTSISSVGCLFRGTPRGTTGSSTEVREFRLDETVDLPVLTRLSILCPSEARVSGTFTVSPTVNLSVAAALAGSSITPTPNPLVIPMADPNGTIRLRAVSGQVETGRVRRFIPMGEPLFRVSADCDSRTIAVDGVCSLVVTKDARPSSGTVRIAYRNDEGVHFQTGVSVTIQ